MKWSCSWLCKRAGRMAGKQRERGRKTACSGSADFHHVSRQRRRSTNRSFCEARPHTPGFTGLAAPETPEKEQMLVKVVPREGTISGVLEDEYTSAFLGEDVNKTRNLRKYAS